MKKLIYLLFSTIVYLGCNNTSGGSQANTNDSTIEVNKKASNEDSELSQIVKDYIQLYKSPFLLDSSYFLGNDTIRISLKHACLMDSSIVIPKKYVGIYGLDSFITNNFLSSITVEKNHNVIMERKISKDDFRKFLDPNLKLYGVLLYPSIKSFPDSIEIRYSLSIPLTDVGIGVGAIIKNNDSLSFIRR